MPNLFNVIMSFLKIGTIGFGGGSALIPVVESEIVSRRKWKDKDDYTKDTIIANITPGALPVKLGALFKGKYSLTGAFAIAMPGTLILLLILTFLSVIGESAIKYIEFASIGISSFIILLLYLYIQKVMDSGKSEGVGVPYAVIMLATFFLTCGKPARQIISLVLNIDYNLMGKPFFGLSAIHIMVISFFIILFGGKSNLKLALSIPVAVLYALSVGKSKILDINGCILPIVMILMTAISITAEKIKSAKGEKEKIKVELSPLKTIFLFVAVSAAACLAAFFAVRGHAMPEGTSFWGYVINVIISSATSFGGGEAYVTVAEGFFVQNGYIKPQVFYNQAVAIANALPGPILVKLACAVGYFFGSEAGGIGIGWIVAMAGFALSVGVSSTGALIVLIGFETLKNSERLHAIKKYILPVVCGMLLSTILSILYEALKIITHSTTLSPYAAFGIVALLFTGMLLLHKKYHLNDLILLLAGGGLTLLAFTLASARI